MVANAISVLIKLLQRLISLLDILSHILSIRLVFPTSSGLSFVRPSIVQSNRAGLFGGVTTCNAKRTITRGLGSKQQT